MRAKITSIILIQFFIGMVTAQQPWPGFQEISGPYFGQKPPGKVPVPFAKGIMDGQYKLSRSITFLPDGSEAYWSVVIHENKIWKRWIVESKMAEGKWTEPKLASFSKYGLEDDVPCISPDGRRLFFISRRPVNQKDSSNKENIWVMDRLDGHWGDPKPLPPAVNSVSQIHHQISVSLNGDLYFGAEQENGLGGCDLYRSRFENGEYQKSENLGPAINSPNHENTPFIAQDGSYLIFCKYDPDGWSLFISFAGENKSWRKPVELNKLVEIPKGMKTDCPFVTPDGKFLFFFCDDDKSNVPYWVEASFIKQIKPNK